MRGASRWKRGVSGSRSQAVGSACASPLLAASTLMHVCLALIRTCCCAPHKSKQLSFAWPCCLEATCVYTMTCPSRPPARGAGGRGITMSGTQSRKRETQLMCQVPQGGCGPRLQNGPAHERDPTFRGRRRLRWRRARCAKAKRGPGEPRRRPDHSPTTARARVLVGGNSAVWG